MASPLSSPETFHKMEFKCWIVLVILSLIYEVVAVVPSKTYRFFSDQHAFSTFDVEAVVPEPMSLPVPEGGQCDESENCVGGECKAATPNGPKFCSCLEGSFHYFLEVPGLNVCLKCRQLGSTCSLHEECQCADKNTICHGATGGRKGHCQCRWTLDIGNATKCPASPQEQCSSTLDCQTSVRFLDASGLTISPPPNELICIPLNTSIPILSWDSDLLLPEIPTVSPEPRLLNRTTTHGCVCPNGFLPSANDSFACQDVDECSDRRGNPCMPQSIENAEVTCVNTIGSYRCECRSGFALNQGLAPHGICCKMGHVPCLDSTKCIPMFKLCDGTPECVNDCSDELYPFCNYNSNRPFPDFLQFPQCHEASFAESSDFVTAKTIEIPPAPKNESVSGIELLPLGSAGFSQTETPPTNIPTLPSNMTAARLLGYVLV